MEAGPVTCPGCKREIDRDWCWCGIDLKSHGFGDGHPFVPMGCDCYRDKRTAAPSEREEGERG